MTTDNLQADAFYDLAKLGQLKSRARTNSKDSIKEVARQFESIFVKMMLKSMRDASEGDPLFDSDSTKMYRDMFDEQMATQLTKEHSIGLADMLERQLSQYIPKSDAAKTGGMSLQKKFFPIHQQETQKPFDLTIKPDTGMTLPKPEQRTFDIQRPKLLIQPQVPPTRVPGMQTLMEQTDKPKVEVPQAPLVKNVPEAPAQFSGDPQEFVSALWPMAKDAAKKLGVAPQLLLAQAALETGWGRAVIPRDDGSSSHNLFNIKADQRWSGDRVNKVTLEYEDGIASKETAAFRAYDSYAQSFADFVTFLKQNQRYESALQNNQEPYQFVSELQQAGYATDPQYANKIMRIINGQPLNSALEKLKLSETETLTKTGT